MYASVCVSIDAMLNVPLIWLRHKTQWEEANLRVEQFWVLNTFPKLYLNSEPIFLVIRSMVLSRENAIYMVLRLLQKLGSDSPFVSIMLLNSNSSAYYFFPLEVNWWVDLILCFSINSFIFHLELAGGT